MTEGRQDDASIGGDGAWRLRVLSWNLHALPFSLGKQLRLDRASTAIRERDPDVVVLQELWTNTDVGRLTQPLEDHYVLVEGPPGGWLRPRPSGLLCLVRKSPDWVINASSFHPFESSGPIWRVWESDGLAGKGVMVIELEYQGQPLTIVNTHFQSEYGATRYAHIRAAQTAELRRIVSRVPPEVAVVAAGDLNTRPNEDEIWNGLLHEWTDLGQAARQRCGCGTYLQPDGRREDWVDYILGRAPRGGRLRTESFELIRNVGLDDPYSDHHGLMATIAIESRPRPAGVLLGVLLGSNARLTRRQWFHAVALASVDFSPL